MMSRVIRTFGMCRTCCACVSNVSRVWVVCVSHGFRIDFASGFDCYPNAVLVCAGFVSDVFPIAFRMCFERVSSVFRVRYDGVRTYSECASMMIQMYFGCFQVFFKCVSNVSRMRFDFVWNVFQRGSEVVSKVFGMCLGCSDRVSIASDAFRALFCSSVFPNVFRTYREFVSIVFQMSFECGLSVGCIPGTFRICFRFVPDVFGMCIECFSGALFVVK